MAQWYCAFMSEQHRGEFQYWKPRRVRSYQQWGRIAWLISLWLALGVLSWAVVVTLVMVFNLPPEVSAR